MSKQFMKIFRGLSFRTATAPTDPHAGDMFFDGAAYKVYDGSAWNTLDMTPVAPAAEYIAITGSVA